MAMVGKKFRVYLEADDGKMLELDALTASITTSCPPIDITCIGDSTPSFIGGMQQTEINLVGLGEVIWTDGQDFLQKKKSAREWKCEFCGHVNPRAACYCGGDDKHAVGCGAKRSFIYD